MASIDRLPRRWIIDRAALASQTHERVLLLYLSILLSTLHDLGRGDEKVSMLVHRDFLPISHCAESQTPLSLQAVTLNLRFG